MRSSVFFIILALLTLPLLAIQWPGVQKDWERSFLEPLEGKPFLGLTFENYEALRPYDNGSTLFRYVPQEYDPLPGMEKAFLVIDHNNQFQSIYTNLEPTGLAEDRLYWVKDDYIHPPQEEPYQEARFFLRDAQLGYLVNPSFLLPPQKGLGLDITPLHLEGAEGSLLSLEGLTSLPRGTYRVYVDRPVSREGRPSQVPYGYQLYNLGVFQFERILGTVKEKEGTLFFGDGAPLTEAFQREGYLYLGDMTLPPGEAFLELIAEDAMGGHSSFSYTLRVTQ